MPWGPGRGQEVDIALRINDSNGCDIRLQWLEITSAPGAKRRTAEQRTMDHHTCARLKMQLQGFGMPMDELKASVALGSGLTTG